eukprot:1132053-Amphidinium_carterae.1
MSLARLEGWFRRSLWASAPLLRSWPRQHPVDGERVSDRLLERFLATFTCRRSCSGFLFC